jgi:hypothetical protein
LTQGIHEHNRGATMTGHQERADELGTRRALRTGSGEDEALATSRLDVSAPAAVQPAHAREILGARREDWLGEVVGVDAEVAIPDGMTRYLLDLQLQVGDRAPALTFRKAAYVDVGPLIEAGPATSVEISWRAATLAPLFPVFSGHLSWKDGALHLRGVYAPPGGGVGLIADRLLLNVAARGTARWLLRRIVAAMRLPEGGAHPGS